MNTLRTYLLALLLLPLFPALGQSDTLRLRERLDRAVVFLERAQIPSGAICDSTNPLFNTWETILATDALLDHYPETHPTVQRALEWLRSNENEQGLICHNSACRTAYCIETSCLYLQLLHRLKVPVADRVALLEQLQQPNGSWQIGNPDVLFRTDYASVTAFMLNLYTTTDYRSGRADAAFAYVAAQQSADGSWGQTWEYYSCPGYALWQCMPPLRTREARRSEWEKAKSYILENQLANGSWYVAENPEIHHVSPQLQTALMLSCLAGETDDASRAAWAKGMDFLLATQLENGGWEGGFFPIPNQRYRKRESIFATALACKLLSNALAAAHE